MSKSHPIEFELCGMVYCLTVEQAEQLADKILCQVYALSCKPVPAPRKRKGAKKR